MDSTTTDPQPMLTSALAKLDAVKDVLTVKRVFGDAYQADGATIIPVAAVRGAGGAGGGEGNAPGDEGTGSGVGLGFGVNARPVGVFAVKDGVVTWTPAVDVSRIALGGQVIGLVAVLVLGRVLKRRRHRG